ncbi:MAG: acyl-CoA dehydrogenase family protein, partial [Actinomycetia bacterium]|nr:acyl-CoA dehydrogenase family protein [Actinomycetes bacterium]
MTETLGPGTLNPIDFLQTDQLLSGEERLVRDTVAQFVTDQVTPNIAQWWDEGILPRDLITQMGDLGLLGMHL